MDNQDLRRLGTTAGVLGLVAVLFLFFLALDDAEKFEWSVPTDSLDLLSLSAWTWIVVGLLALLLVSVMAAASNVARSPVGRAPTRQVQCQNCKAVFFMPDNGRRPLMHACPSCKRLGLYDGKAPPIGRPPEVVPAARIARVQLTCLRCRKAFVVTDTGVRPLHVECPQCKHVGTLQ